MNHLRHAMLSRRQFSAAALASLATAPAAFGQRLPAARHVPWLKEVQTPPEQIPAGEVPPLLPLLVDAGRNPIRTRVQWEAHRTYLRQQWLDMIGEVRPREQLIEKAKLPPTFEIRDSEHVGGIVRRYIRYETERGDHTSAYLMMPYKPKTRLPGVVVLHSTVDYTIRQGAGLEGPPEKHWGLKLAQRGMVVICPRCFLWNDTPPINYEARVEEHKRKYPLSRGIAKMLYDAVRAVDLLTSLNEVDPDRLGAAGHSLGAKEALYLAAFDSRIRATVSSEGGIGTTFSNWDAPWYWGDKEYFGREHHELLALAAPRAFLLMGGNSADGDRSWPFVEAAMQVYRFYGQPCRLGLYNHGQGHAVPPLAEKRAYEWLETYL